MSYWDIKMKNHIQGVLRRKYERDAEHAVGADQLARPSKIRTTELHPNSPACNRTLVYFGRDTLIPACVHCASAQRMRSAPVLTPTESKAYYTQTCTHNRWLGRACTKCNRTEREARIWLRTHGFTPPGE